MKSASAGTEGDPQESLPVRGAWVEIGFYAILTLFPVSRRSPCGERGLKYPVPGGNGRRERRSPCGERGLKSSSEALTR